MPSATKRSPDEELEHLRNINANYASRIARLEFKLSTTENELKRAKAELLAQRRLKKQIKDLYRSLDARILNTIDRRGYTRKVKQVSFSDVALPDDALTDRSQLQTYLRDYDAKTFFRLKSPKVSMKLQYRFASKLYRTSRDTTLKLAVKTYRLSKRGHHA